MLRALVVVLVIGLVGVAFSADCIGLEGSCLNNARIVASCAAGDARSGFECPQGSTCCLPLGALCVERKGSCLERCPSGNLMDPDLPCPDGGQCCVPRVDAFQAAATPPRANTKIIQDGHHALMDQVTAAVVIDTSVVLTIVTVFLFVIIFGAAGCFIARRSD